MKIPSLPRLTNWALILASFTLLSQFIACDVRAQNGTPRKYDRSGTVELEKVYHVDLTKDKTLRALGYTEAMLPDTFPAFTEYWRMHGWPRAEMLDLYPIECAANDVIYGTDGYYGKGFYIRANFISQSRAHIVFPCGKYHVRFGILTAIGRYTGANAQLSSDATGTLLGGTGIEIDHFGWSVRQPNRVCINATNWGTDYGTPGIAGLAYAEGVVVENFRLMGNKANAGGFTGFSTGVTLNEPGEQSAMNFCMAEDFTGAGYTIFNGTPFVTETCSAFENNGPGFDFLGSNGLCNLRIETPSGDNNRGGLIRIRPKDGQSVGGGTITIKNLKSESRNVTQIPVAIEGVMGDLNLGIDGLTADFIGVTCPYLIGGNWTGTQFEISARNVDLRSNTLALAKSATVTLTGGKQYSGNSFVWNDEGLAFKSRANMVLSTGTVTCTWTTGAETCAPCVGNTQTCTTPYVSSVAGCTPSGSKPPDVVRTQACGTPPPTGNTISTSGWTVTASATNSGGRELPAYAIDADLATVWSSGIRQDASDQWIQFAAPAEQTFKTASFALPTAWSNDYARTAQVYVGSSSTGGAAVSATITGTNPMVVTFSSPVKGKYFRLTAKRTNNAPNWFTVGMATFTKP